MRLAETTLLGRYEIGALLGAGGMGEVYAARDIRLDRPVAVKVLPDALARDPERLARFQREAKLLAALNHPCIAAIHGFEETEDGGRLLILERVSGETLAARIRRGPLPLEEALAVCGQIAEALDAAHQRGVIHRDLKPSNVMLTPAARVKLLDFGIAKHAAEPGIPPEEAPTETALTAAGVAVGTPGYMSPEQLRGEPVDARSDVFSFGCVLFECLAGRRPFAAGTALEEATLALRGEVSWAPFPADAPPALRALAAGCLKPEAEARPDGMAAARRALDSVTASPEEGPVPAVASATPHNLPHALARFVGRGAEIAACRGLLAKRRLLTLVGTGGTGKTRLAIRLAELLLDEYPDGVWLVDLAPVGQPERVGEAVAIAVQVSKAAGRSVPDSLIQHLDGSRTLVILDNCEHVLGAVARLAEMLLQGCPGLHIVATSRERLGVTGEQTFPVAPLSLPAPAAVPRGGTRPGGDAAQPSDSVRLFLDRARLIHPGFDLTEESAPVVADICRRLDGIPLAIELAAARLRTLTLPRVRAMLDDRFRLLTTEAAGAEPRHRSLEAALAWSYELLTEPERRLFRALSVFAGGFSLGGAEAVIPEARDDFEVLDLVSRLVDKSLVVVAHQGDRTRYRLLETIRQYAHERLVGAGELAVTRNRHLESMRRFAEASYTRLGSPDQTLWLVLTEEEHENLLKALAWCESSDGGAPVAVAMVGHSWLFWSIRGYHDLGRREMERALNRPGAEARDIRRCRALYGAGWLASLQGDTSAARPRLLESLAIAREIGDSRAISRALTGLGVIAFHDGDYASARERYEESVRINRQLENPRGLAAALNNLGNVAYHAGDYERAIALSEEAMVLHRKRQDQDAEAGAFLNITQALQRLGRIAEARRTCAGSLAIASELGARHLTACGLAAAGYLAGALRDWVRAARLIGAAEGIWEELGYGLSRLDRAEHEAEAAKLREALGATEFAEHRRAGRAMDEAAAVGLALDVLGGGRKELRGRG
jgi:predicted ATPase